MLKWLKSRLTMKRRHCLFVDKVSGEEVFLWIDCYGIAYMCGWSRWGMRVRRS